MNVTHLIPHRAKYVKRYLSDAFHFNTRSLRVNPSLVFLESFDGTSQTCSPLAIFEHLITNEKHNELSFVWSYRGATPNGSIWSKYRSSKRVRWVRHGSKEYYFHLARAKYLITNSTFPHQFTKKPGQIYLNTWHGIPIKKMGYDIPLGIPQTRNVVRNLLAADFILSPNDFMSEQIWPDSFKLEGLYSGKLLKTGTPRLDALHERSMQNDNFLSTIGIEDTDERQIILYAPTWRGTSPSDINDTSVEILNGYSQLVRGLDESKYIVLLKVHQLALRKISQKTLQNVRLVDNSIPTSDVLRHVSQLVTDESSIAIDFLLCDKPIHFYFPDMAQIDRRGLYFNLDELPGTISGSMDEIYSQIHSSSANDPMHERRSAWRRRFLPNEDGRATESVIDAVFNGDTSNTAELQRPRPETSQRILIHVGSLIPNGITTAAVNIVNKLANAGHDVTIFYPYSSSPHQVAKVYEFSKSVRHLPRVGNIAIPLLARRSYRRYLSHGGRAARNVSMKMVKQVFSREWRRCFGNSEFDTVIAFDGYSVFWAELLLASNAPNRVIWMHNDLMQDAHRTINGRMPHHNNLKSLFTLYKDFDKIVSVSPDLTNINRGKMARYAPAKKFVTVQNFIDDDEVRRLSKAYTAFEPGTSGANFVSVGRLSPEKNQEQMIRAMERVVRQSSSSNLYIIGDGPLRERLEALIRDLGLQNHVHLLGYHKNPHALVAKCDCFLFSSSYEGQGLALIEAMVLGKPIVTTEFNVVHSVVGPNDGIITDTSDSGLAQGMLEYLRGGMSAPTFDAEKHNELAAKELQAIIHPRAQGL